MDIIKTAEYAKLLILLKGSFDYASGPEFEKAVTAQIQGITELSLDFSDVDYISSAGFRQIILLQRKMAAQNGHLVLLNVPEHIYSMFELVHFDKILTMTRK